MIRCLRKKEFYYIHFRIPFMHGINCSQNSQWIVSTFTNSTLNKNIIGNPYSQRDFKPRLTKHDFNDFSICDKIDK